MFQVHLESVFFPSFNHAMARFRPAHRSEHTQLSLLKRHTSESDEGNDENSLFGNVVQQLFLFFWVFFVSWPNKHPVYLLLMGSSFSSNVLWEWRGESRRDEVSAAARLDALQLRS